MQAVLCPVPGRRREDLELGTLRDPAGEGDHPVLRGVAGIEGQHGEMGALKCLRQRHPPLGDGADDVERGAESGVGEQKAAAAVDDVGVPVEGEELQAALLEIATAGGARESRLLGVGVAVVEHGGGEQRQPPQEVVVGDEAAPGSGDALEPEQGLQREPGEDLHEHIVAHGGWLHREREREKEEGEEHI